MPSVCLQVTMGDDTKLEDPVKKAKKKAKKICKCGFGWLTFGIVALIIGIVLLVQFSKYWHDDQEWQR